MKRFAVSRWLPASVLGVVILNGCATPEPPPPPPPPPAVPAPAATVDSVRSALAASYPNVKVASVGEVLPNDPFLATTDINVADFPLEAIVTIIDGESNPVAYGVVEKLVNNQAHIRFEVSPGVTRRPQLGDLVVAGLNSN